MVATITRDALKAKIDRNERIAILEALPPMYYEAAHLPGALNMPLDEVSVLAPTLLPDKQQEIVVYCSNAACQNSTAAVHRLNSLGYTRVLKYAEGKQDWVEAGFPTESGSRSVSA